MTKNIPKQLPLNWAESTLDQLGYLYCGQSSAVAEVNHDERGIPYVTGPEQWDGNQVVENKWTEYPRRIVPEGCIFITVKGAGVGKMFPGIHAAIGRDIYAFKPHSEMDFDFVFFAIRHSIDAVVANAQGDIPGLSKSHILDHIVAIPGYDEQCRISAKVRELFSELDGGVDSLRLVLKQLKVYRQAILLHAFTGKLTSSWRRKNIASVQTGAELLAQIKRARNDKYEIELREWSAMSGPNGRPRAPKELSPLDPRDLDELRELPPGWILEKLGWGTCGVEYGTAAKSSGSGTVPVLRMGNIQNAKIDWLDLAFTSDKEEIDKYGLKVGDVLFNRTNSPELVGKTAIYRGERPALFAGYLIRVNQIPNIVDGQYLNLFLNSHIARQHGGRVKTDGVNQSNINGAKLSNYPFPYCPLAEQQEIVKLLDEKLSIVDQMEEDIEQEIHRTDALRQSILKRALAGSLVTQRPEDEIASALLGRIKAAKTEGEQVRTKNGGRKAA